MVITGADRRIARTTTDRFADQRALVVR